MKSESEKISCSEAVAEGVAVGPAFSLCTAADLELLICGLPYMGNFQELPARERMFGREDTGKFSTSGRQLSKTVFYDA